MYWFNILFKRFKEKIRKETDYLELTIDTLRNWELNGLLTVKRRENSYRVYNDEDIKRLKIISSLRCANYSLSAILRLLKQLDENTNIYIQEVLNTPKKNEDIVSACDKLLLSLKKCRNWRYKNDETNRKNKFSSITPYF